MLPLQRMHVKPPKNQAPTVQRISKLQSSNAVNGNPELWSFVIEASLELGCWNLEFLIKLAWEGLYFNVEYARNTRLRVRF
jgi:hypothetical protein